jgi:hypothetical protein
MATVSITSNEGALESASAVLEVTATNPKRTRTDLRYGILVRNLPDECNTLITRICDVGLKVANSSAVIAPGVWRKWRLHLLRIGTRETTAVLYLDEDGKMEEQDRLDWDSTAFEPLVLRVGIGRSSAGASATVLADELRLTETLL